MTLSTELKRDVLDENVPVSSLLRKALVIAKEIRDAKNERWISAELKGYADDEEVPDYRDITGRVIVRDHYTGWQYLYTQNLTPDKVKIISSFHFRAALSEYEGNAKQEFVAITYSERAERKLIELMGGGPMIPAIQFTGVQFQRILDSVRNKLVDWVSDLSDVQPANQSIERLSDRALMERAIELAKKCVSEPGKVSPKVGAVLARNGVIIGEAYRGELMPGDHAEFTLLEGKLGGEILTGATLFTTLEPCTTRNDPKIPCAVRVAERHIAKVFIGSLDRNDDIRGRGEFHLIDAGIQIDRFDPDLMPVLEELNREFIRSIRQRSRAETKDPVDPEAVGPNGFKIGYTENGDKVEWIEEDGETWPMILRRNDADILEMYNELWEKVWYIRKIIRFEKMQRGEVPYEDQNQPHLIKALERMKQIEDKYGLENLVWPDVEWGIVQGKLSALSWVMGSEWEGSLDT